MITKIPMSMRRALIIPMNMTTIMVSMSTDIVTMIMRHPTGMFMTTMSLPTQGMTAICIFPERRTNTSAKDLRIGHTTMCMNTDTIFSIATITPIILSTQL